MAYLIGLLSLCLALVGGYWYVDKTAHAKGYHERDFACAAEKIEIKNAQLEAERQSQAQRERGRIVADRLAAELAETRAALVTAQERTSREISARASATRRCFSGSVAELLNSVTPIRVSSTPIDPAGTTATGTDAQAGTAAADPSGPGVSERAAAEALNISRTGYESCRTQLGKLIDWAKDATGG